MKRWITICVLALGMASQAEEAVNLDSSTGWKFSLGLTHRALGDLSLNSAAFVNSTFGGDYVNGSFEPAGGLLLVDNALQLNLPSAVSLDRISFSGADEDMDTGLGLILEMEKPFRDNGCYALSWQYSLMVVGADQDVSQGATVASDAFDISAAVGAFPFYAGVPVPTVDGGTATSTGMVNVNADLTLFTFAAGVKSNWVKDAFAVSVSGGPTMSIASYDVDRSLTTTGTGANVSKDSDVGLELKLGLYVGLGLSYRLSETVALGFEYRYDYAFSDLDMGIAEQELSGSSASLKLSFDL
jgi:opacity protein-like surface antigen